MLFLVAPFADLCRFDIRNGSLILARRDFVLNELAPIFLLLLLCMLIIFAGALLYGRLWCGWVCPQTTLSELAAAIERLFARRPKPLTGVPRVAATAGILALSALVAASLTSYFIDPAEYLAPTPPLWITFGVFFAIVAADLLWVRHSFCVGICPYGILQGIVADDRTLGVRFDADLARCGSCRLCILSCVMGIDMRKQPVDMSCLNCGDCIDVANALHQKRKIPLVQGLGFGTRVSAWPAWLTEVGVSDWRRAVVVSAVVGLSVLTTHKFATRADIDVRLAPQFERATVEAGGTVRNYFNLSLGNHLRQAVRLRMEVTGLEGLDVESPVAAVQLAARQRTRVPVVLASTSPHPAAGAHSVTLRLKRNGDKIDVPARFFVPERKELP